VRLLKDLTHRLQVVEVLPSHPIPPGRHGNGVATSNHREWHGGIVTQEKPVSLPPLHRCGHGDVKVEVDTMSRIDMNNCTLKDRPLSIWVLQMLDTEEIIPHIKPRVDPWVSLTQSHEGRLCSSRL
jgi:hypothetical protein